MLLAVKNWNDPKFAFKDLSFTAKTELINLYQLINNKDKLQKLEKVVNKIQASKQKNRDKRPVNYQLKKNVDIAIGVGLAVIFLLGGLWYFYWSKKTQKSIK